MLSIVLKLLSGDEMKDKRRILLVSSDYTGHGHKSISMALTESLSDVDPDLVVSEINGFSLGGHFGTYLEKLYVPLVTNAPPLWKAFFVLADNFSNLFNIYTAHKIETAFLEALKINKPDLIISVHPGFVGSIHKLLDKHKLDIPVIVMISDLISIADIWFDKRCAYILCPTDEAKLVALHKGISEDKIKVFGFPLRQKFCRGHLGKPENTHENEVQEPLDFLVFANAFGKRQTKKTILTLLENFDCRVTLLTGRDDALKISLEKSLLPLTKGRLILPGYVTNMEEFMQQSDLLITKAGPNILMEAIHCGIPVVISGRLPGQEEGNPGWILARKLGLSSFNLRHLSGVVSKLLANDHLLLREIAANQHRYATPDATRETAIFLSTVSKSL